MRNAGAGFASAHITIIYQISPDFTSTHYSIRDNKAQCRPRPSRFVHFLGYRIASAVIVLSVLPACMGIFIAMTHGSLAPDIVYRPIAFAGQALLLLYYVSIILIFFPNVRKTDLPLLIGIMVIPLAIFWIPLGLRRGRAQWKEWPRNA
jgi:hypothetical protein